MVPVLVSDIGDIENERTRLRFRQEINRLDQTSDDLSVERSHLGCRSRIAGPKTASSFAWPYEERSQNAAGRLQELYLLTRDLQN
jgi:hypothetical protein